MTEFTVTNNYPGGGPFASRFCPLANYIAIAPATYGVTEMTRGNLYKVIAEQAVHTAIENTPGVQKWPTNEMDTPIGLLSNALLPITAILTSVLGALNVPVNLPTLTSRQAMKTMATNRSVPTFNTMTRQVQYDGGQKSCDLTVDDMDSKTKDKSSQPGTDSK